MTTKENWKPVTISGLTGILMGAGAVYGVQAMAAGADNTIPAADESLKVATVDDSMSFGEAFSAAREQVGAGGVFTWHGKIFNTYTAEEWSAMPDNDKQLFAEQVKPEISASEVETTQLVDNAGQSPDTIPQDDDVKIADSHAHNISETQESHAHTTSWDELAEDDDVRVVGFRDIELNNGRSIAMQEVDINGQRVAIIDVDKDGTPDLAMTDLNHNNQMDDGEVIDLHTGEAISFANDDPAIGNIPDTDPFTA